MNNGYNDISYNFLIGYNGIIEGRGWDVRPEPDSSFLKIGFLSASMFAPDDNSAQHLTALIADGKAIGRLTKLITYQFGCDEVDDPDCTLPFDLK